MGVDLAVMEHYLYILANARSVKQKRRHFGPEKDKVIRGEAQKLLEVGHVQELWYPTWLSNIVLAQVIWEVAHVHGILRFEQDMPQGLLSLVSHRPAMDSTTRLQFISTMDTYQGYHQIPLAKMDQVKVNFINAEGTFCYTVM